MKKLIVFVLALVCMFSLFGCYNAEGNEVMEDFVGIITNINKDDASYLVEVTDSSSSSLKVGDRVIVQTVDRCNVEYSVGDYLKVEFNGVVETLTATSMADEHIPKVFAIEKVDTTD